MRRVRSALSSLRWKLTVTFVALLAVLLAGLGAFQYLTLQRTLIDTRSWLSSTRSIRQRPKVL